MRKLLVLLGIVCIFALSGCGKSDDISGIWVPKQQEGTGISSIVLNFDDKHTIAHMGQSVQPEDTFIKK